MNNKPLILVTSLLLLLAQAPSNAAPVSFFTNSNITSVSGDALAGISSGNAISIQFNYDNATPVSSVGPEYAEYAGSNPLSISFASGSTTFTWQSADNFIQVIEDSYIGTSQYYESLLMTGTNATSTDTLGGFTPLRVSLSFGDRENCFVDPCLPDNIVPMLSDTSIPDHPFNFEYGTLQFYFTSTTGSPDATIGFDASSATMVSAVPIPASLLLMLSGLGVFTCFTRGGEKRIG